jgi:purine-nucleoside phosphorylase
VESHKGRLLLGDFHGIPAVMMQGRFHYYEGYSMQQIALPVRAMRLLGAKKFLVMNAVGSVNPLIPAGSLVLVQDHINLMGDNPLIGPNADELGPRFPDMSQPYSRRLIALAESIALQERIPQVHRGVLVAVTGPCFETAAEYRMFQRIGADIVGMSTIPEVITAAHCGLETLCISVVTDECLPDALEPVSLAKVLKTVEQTEPHLEQLVRSFVKSLPTL